MAAELDIITAGRSHQDELLAEARARRLLSTRIESQDESRHSGRRLQTLLRRLAGAPTFA
jgi:hypothetical protein